MTPDQAVEPTQLDLFLDGRDAFLIHEVVTSLLGGDADRAASHLASLREEHPAHPDLPALTLLADTPHLEPLPAAARAIVAGRVDVMERDIVPAARRFLGAQAGIFLRPLWRALALAAAHLPFDASDPRAHPGWLHQQYEDWAGARAAVEAEPEWREKPILRYWLGLARHHLGEPDAGVRLWLSLCWTDPDLFTRHAATLPNAIVRDGWDTFERRLPFDELLADATDAVAWFPAWLLARHPGLAHAFASNDIPDAGLPTRVFRALVALVPLERHGLSDELVARRRALQQLSPGFFRSYMDLVARRRSGG